MSMTYNEISQHVASECALLARRMLVAVAKHSLASQHSRKVAEDALVLLPLFPQTDEDVMLLRRAETAVADAKGLNEGADDGYLVTRFLGCAERSLEDARVFTEVALGYRRP